VAAGKLGSLLMSLFIEYYEVKTREGYEYYFMPVNADAKNKENFDSRSHRIWKFNTRSNRITEIKNIRKDKPQVNRAEFLKIQLMSTPVPYSDYYLDLEKIKSYRAELEAKKSSSVD
jgi:hypothetical protein